VLAYIIRRILATVPVMAVVALFVFSLLHLSPGDPAVIIAGDTATLDDIVRIRQKLGLDQPLYVQFVTWVWGLLHGDLGISIFTNLPVSKLIAQRVEPTITLTISTLIISVLAAIPMGVLAAWKAGGWIDRLVMVFAVIGFSVPSFVLAYVLIYVFAISTDLLPVQGFVSIGNGFWPFLSHIAMPSLALGMIFAALIARMTRASMLDVLAQDYIRTAQAKGLSNDRVLIGHRSQPRPVDLRGRCYRDGIRDPRLGPADRRRDPAPRLPDHSGDHPGLFSRLRTGQSARRSELYLSRSAYPVLVR
jgi:peptide/nickel transport system permease protein